MFRRRTPDGQLTWVGKAIRHLGFGRLLYHCYTRPKAYLQNRLLPSHPVELPLFGYTLHLPAPKANFCFAQIYTDGVWEPEVTEEIRRRVKPGMNVVDIGADIGYYVLLFASLNGEGSIFAFEPNPVNYPILAETIRSNRLNKVKLFQCGLGDHHIPEATFSAVTAQTDLTSQNVPTDASFKTEIRLLDDVIQEIAVPAPRVDFVLMDVEGAEMNVLLGMRQILQRDKPMILIELHGPLLPQFQHSKAGLVDWLSQRGYRAQWVAGEAIDAPGYSHAFFVPIESTQR